jgi:hypothetical protein
MLLFIAPEMANPAQPARKSTIIRNKTGRRNIT